MPQVTIVVSIFVILVTGVWGEVSTENQLKCYQCTVTKNSQCTEDYLKECPKDHAYDLCTTSIRKTADLEENIVKGCSLGPCTLRDTIARGVLGMAEDTCDRSGPEYDCFYCCHGDGCNKDAVLAHTPYCPMVLALVITAIFHLLSVHDYIFNRHF